MKLITRLLLTTPLILGTYFYLRFSLSDNGCSGLIDLFFDGFFIILFLIGIIIAYKAIFRKRNLYNKKTEPFSLTITLITLIVLVIGKVFGEDFKGKTWIYAEANKDKLERQYLTLRNNGTFKVDLSHVDFSCYFSGQYQKRGDTIFLDEDVVTQTNSLLTRRYLLQDTLLKPINDTKIDSIKFSEFVINPKK